MAGAAVVALVAAACGSGGGDGSSGAEPVATETPADAPAGTAVAETDGSHADAITEAPETTDTEAEPADPEPALETTTTVDPEELTTIGQINDYIAEAAAFDQAGADSQFPAGLTFAAGGAPGYSRYVFREHSEGVVPTLVEGPLLGTVRCQDEALPCSYLELRALHESGGEIPAELQMTPAELAELVSQLDTLNAFAVAHRDIDAACSAGFISDRTQTPNMGTHLYRVADIGDGFDPGAPEILLYARADGVLPSGALGQCVDGAWNGEPMELVGTAFIIPPQVIGIDHPDAFAGPLDNWHIHYNLCRSNTQGRDTFVPRDQCLAEGGNFSEALGWMLHAWVDPQHDNQLGVFSMWNSSIPPIAGAAEIRDGRVVRGSDFPEGAEQSIIADFLYTGELTVRTGQPLFFNNADAVPHTVTAGTPDDPELAEFDSGLLTPGSNFEVAFEQTGTYSLFCTLHPDMIATVTVTD